MDDDSSAEPTSVALNEDDECQLGSDSECAANALQLRAQTKDAERSSDSARTEKQRPYFCVFYPWSPSCQRQQSYDNGGQDPNNVQPTQAPCVDSVGSCAAWAANGECQNNPNYMLTACRMSCQQCVAGPAPNGAPTPWPAGTPTPPPTPMKKWTCATIDDDKNSECKDPVTWGATSGKNDPHASEWYAQMHDITGVTYQQATQDDFQRLFFCAPPGGKACGVAPCGCSKPPCNTCYGGMPPPPKRPGCEDGGLDVDSMKCKPPAMPLDYKGMEWPATSYPGAGPIHIFAIGDWGGLDGTLNPIEDRPAPIAYKGGNKPGPSVFQRNRWTADHSRQLCTFKEFGDCYSVDGNLTGDPPCAAGCGFVKGVDDQPQILVADAMAKRAATQDPAFILNVGDNFYWGGIEKNCGTPMDEISFTAHHQFDQIYEKVYKGPGLDGKSWFSVLGNHDWGGRCFNNGWDQQIAYTWTSTRWVLPAPYYNTHVNFPDAGISMDIYMLDSNVNDAEDPEKDPEHNICGAKHNPKDADCSAVGGPSSVDACKQWFESLWKEQQTWLEGKIAQSTADWQIIVTHFPCGTDSWWYRKLHQQYGLDLLVTGHRHDQELWDVHEQRNHMGGLVCFVTGGGGGISSEATPDPNGPRGKKDWYGEAQYGFFDLTFTKVSLTIESINYDGTLMKTTSVQATRGMMR